MKKPREILTRAYLDPALWRRLRMASVSRNQTVSDVISKMLDKNLPQYAGRKPNTGGK